MVQWLRLCAPNAGGPGSIPGQVIRSHMVQPRVLTPQQRLCMLQLRPSVAKYIHTYIYILKSHSAPGLVLENWCFPSLPKSLFCPEALGPPSSSCSEHWTGLPRPPLLLPFLLVLDVFVSTACSHRLVCSQFEPPAGSLTSRLVSL